MKETKDYITYQEMEQGDLFNKSKLSKLEMLVI